MDTINEAFQAVKREDFLPPAMVEQAQYDVALPIGYGQTNSQPCTVRSMLEWLEPQEGNKVLDVGSGSGWTTALLARIVGKKGRVYAVERIPELVEFGRKNCETARIIEPSEKNETTKFNVNKGQSLETNKMLHNKFSRTNSGNVGEVSFHQAGEVLGLPEEAPFDRILVSASATELPEELLEQLKVGGKMVVPVGYDILEVAKKSQLEIKATTHSGFIFVPLLKS